MNEAKKRTYRRAVIFLVVGSLMQYALFHVSNLMRFGELGEVFGYVTYYFDRVWEFFFPALSATLMLITLSKDGYRHALTGGIGYAVSRAAYYIPLGYMMALGYGYDSIESLFSGLFLSILMAVVAYLESLLCVLLAILPAHFKAKREGSTSLPLIAESLPRADALDVSDVGAAAVGIISLVQFIKLIAVEIADTVEFFLDGAAYSTDEIIYIVFKYVFAILILAITYFVLFRIKRRVGACEDDEA